MIQRFYYVSAKEAYLSIDHTNHTYNYYTKFSDTNMDADYIDVPLRSIKAILEDIINSGYTESKYQL